MKLRAMKGSASTALSAAVFLCACVCSLGLSCGAQAHEAPGHRASLVWRDGGHFALSVQANLLEVLHATLAPGSGQAGAGQLLLELSAISPEAFALTWVQAQRRWESEWVLLLKDGTRVRAAQWRWPTAKSAQAALQEQLMQHLTGAADAPHAPLEAAADFIVSPTQSEATELALSAAFAPLRLSTSRPRQTTVEPQAPRVTLQF